MSGIGGRLKKKVVSVLAILAVGFIPYMAPAETCSNLGDSFTDDQASECLRISQAERDEKCDTYKNFQNAFDPTQDELDHAKKDCDRATKEANQAPEEVKKAMCNRLAAKYEPTIPQHADKGVALCSVRKDKAVGEMRTAANQMSQEAEGSSSTQEACSKNEELQAKNEQILKNAIEGQDDDEAVHANPQDRACRTNFKTCSEDYTKDHGKVQDELSSIGGRCPRIDAVLRAMETGEKKCTEALQKQREELRKSLASIKLSAGALAKCRKASCASGDDCEKPGGEKKSVAKSAGKDGDSGDGEKTKKKQQQQANGMQMPQMPSPSSGGDQSSNSFPQATNVNNDGCYGPGGDSKPGCACLLTGNCRNGDAPAVAALGPMPGQGGAKMTKNTTSSSPGSAGPVFPGGNAEQSNGGGGGVAGGGGGGGGGFGSGGGAKAASSNPTTKARSALAADILSGTRGGAGRGSSGRTHPGFSSSDFSSSRSPASADLSRFEPDDSRAALMKAIPSDTSGSQESPSAQLHPAAAELFSTVRPRYQQEAKTLIVERPPG